MLYARNVIPRMNGENDLCIKLQVPSSSAGVLRALELGYSDLSFMEVLETTKPFAFDEWLRVLSTRSVYYALAE